MFINLLWGLSVMAACLLLQSLLVVTALHYYVRRQPEVTASSRWSTLLIVNGVMLLLVSGNIAQVGLWALLFIILGEFPDFAGAFYHSAVNFSTLGYGDVVMSDKNRLLGPLEAINGVLMIGVSTAVLMATFQDALKKSISGRKGKSDHL